MSETAVTDAPITTIEGMGQHEGQMVRIRGWLRNKRSSGKIHFLIIRDGTGQVQGVSSKADVTPELFEQMAGLTQETAIEVWGLVKADARAPGGFELNVKDLKVIGGSVDFPITPKEHGVDFLMDNRHLWLRSQRQQAILRIRHEIMKACHDWLDEHGFVRVDSPILTPAACEGTTTLFQTDYFGSPAFLSQSGQLYNEANAMAMGRVYCFGPTFRAEKSKTRRHLMEFWMVEPEMAFVENDENMEIQEQFVSYIVQRVLEKRRPELAVLERDVTRLESVKPPFPRVSYDDAVKILKEAGRDFEWGGDFGAEDETIISGVYDRPIFVHRFPTVVKAFYMKPDPQRPEVVLGADMLAPEGYGEIIGGGQREDDLDVLVRKIEEHKLPMEVFEWYLDLRRYGSVPHSGFGMGIERVVAWVCGLEHVRETIPYARMLYRMAP